MFAGGRGFETDKKLHITLLIIINSQNLIRREMKFLNCFVSKGNDLNELLQPFTRIKIAFTVIEFFLSTFSAFLVQVSLNVQIHENIQKPMLLAIIHSSQNLNISRKAINHLEFCLPVTMTLLFQNKVNIEQQEEKHHKMNSLPLESSAMTAWILTVITLAISMFCFWSCNSY